MNSNSVLYLRLLLLLSCVFSLPPPCAALVPQRAVVLEPGEKKLYTLVQQLNTIRNAKAKLRAEQQARKRKEYDKKRAKLENMSEEHAKAERKKRYRAQGQEEARKKARTERGGGRGKGKKQGGRDADD